MFAYHLRLGLKSLRRNPVLTALMIGAIALGIAVCLTTLNVYRLVSGNPLAARNDVVFAVTMDGWDPKEPNDKKRPELAPLGADLSRRASGVRVGHPGSQGDHAQGCVRDWQRG